MGPWCDRLSATNRSNFFSCESLEGYDWDMIFNWCLALRYIFIWGYSDLPFFGTSRLDPAGCGYLPLDRQTLTANA